MQGRFWIINSDHTLNNFLKRVNDEYAIHRYLLAKLETGKTRTEQQNAALHVFLRMVAEALNEKGITFEMFFKPGFEVPWTEEIVKDHVWRPLQKALTGEVKTSNATRTDYSEVYDHLNVKLAEHGIHVPWPTKDNK